MARPLRIEYEGALYHVTSRGNERKNIYYSDRDKERFLGVLEKAYKRYKIDIHAYCLMSNHYHLLVETRQANLSKCMQYINSSYTTFFNRKRKRCGHLFQHRYTGILIEEASYLVRLSQYIHLNPIRAKMVNRPEDYDWSSYKYFVNTNNALKVPEYLNIEKTLSYFSNKELMRNDSVGKYRKYVEEGLVAKVKNPFLETFANVILGEKEFADEIKKKYIDKNKKFRDLPDLRKINAEVAAPEKIFKIIDEKGDGFNLKNKKILKAYFLRTYTDYSLEEISRMFLKDKSASAISNVVQRFEKKIEEDSKLNGMVTALGLKMCSGEA